MSPPASVTITQLEPVIFLRGQSSSGEDARGRRRPVNFDAPPSQLRALVTVHLPKPSKIKEISISLKGTARTDWPEGIGPNRVEMVEEMTIFQHSISLFNAKDANDSVPRARPRSNSVGPGIGLQEDVDWDYAAAAASARTSARQPSGSLPRPINTTGCRDEESSKNSGSQGQSGSNLARQIALGAAKAGSAIIPPTLRPDLSHMKLRDSPTSPSHLRPPARPPLHRTGSGTTSWTSEQTSPDLEATSPRLSPTANLSGSWTRSGPSTNGSATSPQDLSRWHDYFESQGYERPPLYAPRSAPLQGYDSWPTELPSDASAAAPQVAGPDGQAASSLGSVSSSAAPSTSTTPLDRSAANSAQGLARLNAALTAVAQPRSKFGAAVHSASPPSTAPGRSILHTQSPSAPRSKEQTVRFDPQSRVDNAAAAASNASNNKASGTRSNPSSRRSSMELDKNSLKGKSSSKAGHDTKGKKPGLKNLINGLLKEPAADSKTPSEEPALSDSKEFKKGTYTYPISISLPSNLPPTLHADFGFNRYILRAHVVRSGALTPNLVAEREVTLIHAPDEDALEETDAIVVERCWEDLLSYMVVFSGKSFPVGQKIPLWLKFVPLGKVKIYRILATLEERTDYFAKGRRVARHEVPRKWTLLKIGHTSSAEPILPVVSDSADALDKSPLAPLARAAANEDEDSDALASILDPTGPWELATELPIPAGASTRINLSTNHSKSNIAVHHLVRLSIRVGRSQGEWQVWSDGAANASSSAKPAPQLYDIIIEAPITLNHSHTASEWTALPNYWSLPAEPEDADSARASPERESAPTRPALPLPVLTSRTGLVGQSHSTTPSRAGPGGENSPTGSPPMSRNPTQLSRRWLALSADQNARDGSASAGSNGGSVPPPAYQANARTGERTVASTSMSRSPSTADTSEGAVRDATGPPASTQAANAVGMAH